MNIVLFEAEELTDPTPGSPAPPGASSPRGRQRAASSRAVRQPAGPRPVRLPAADRRARHIIDVLRLGPGDTFRAGVVDGADCAGRLVSIEADGGLRIELESGAEAQNGSAKEESANEGGASVRRSTSTGAAAPANPGSAARPLYPVRLLLGHPRPIVLRRLLRDLSTLGIEQLVVARTELGEKSYLESKLWQGDDVRRLLVEGAEQAGSTMLPRVAKAWRLADAIGQIVEGREGAPRVVFDNAAPGEAAAGGRDAAASDAAAGGAAGTPVSAGPGRIIAVGSERGWTDGERSVLRDNGFETARLGERILRTETAAIAAVTVTLRELGIV